MHQHDYDLCLFSFLINAKIVHRRLQNVMELYIFVHSNRNIFHFSSLNISNNDTDCEWDWLFADKRQSKKLKREKKLQLQMNKRKANHKLYAHRKFITGKWLWNGIVKRNERKKNRKNANNFMCRGFGLTRNCDYIISIDFTTSF